MDVSPLMVKHEGNILISHVQRDMQHNYKPTKGGCCISFPGNESCPHAER